MRLKNYDVFIELIPKGKIIAYKLEDYITLEEFKLLPTKLKKKFKPIHETYNVRYK